MSVAALRRFLPQILVFLTIIIFCSILYLSKYYEDYDRTKLLKLLNKANNDLSDLQKRYAAIQNSTKCVPKLVETKKEYNVPTSDYQLLTRKIVSNIEEFSYYLTSEMSVLKRTTKLDKDVSSHLDRITSMGLEYKRALINNMKKLIEVDGFEKWRKNEIEDLSNIVQKRLAYLQNPIDCQNAKKLVCSINYNCGFGCQIHHLVTCLIVAYGMQRTLILKSDGWGYAKNGWEQIFMPISDTCTTVNRTDRWPGTDNSEAIEIPTKSDIKPRPKYIPIAIPHDLVQRLESIHGNPAAWWVGQICKYVWKKSSKTIDYIKMRMDLMNITGPYVGIHIRRTDKIGTEAKFYALVEYMDKVNEYYNQIETQTKDTTRRVYIATDDYSVISEAKAKYPQYEIGYNENVPKNKTHTTDWVLNIMLDVHLLSRSKFLVCTFSSNICRLAYELMQMDYVDASTMCVSLDDTYLYTPQMNRNRYKSILQHKAQRKGEMDLLPGDIIHFSNNYWNGFSSGKNLRTNKGGAYPTFKADLETEVVEFPTYSEMNSTAK